MARLVGAPVAGLLVTLFGALNVLLVDAGTFLASAAIVAAFVRLSPQRTLAAAGAPQPGGTSYWKDLRAGLKFVLRDRLLRGRAARARHQPVRRGERVPGGMRVRVYGVIGAGTWLAMPIGSLLRVSGTHTSSRSARGRRRH